MLTAYIDKLDVGQRRRVPHCGEDTSMIVSRTVEGYSAYCFRCHEKEFKPTYMSWQEARDIRERAQEADREAQRGDLRLPRGMVHDVTEWPRDARVWLYKAGINNDMIAGLGFYWSTDLQRVVMPVYDEGSLVYWQARGIYKWQVKYINPAVDRSNVLAKYSTGLGNVLVLTEDILSAVRVSKITEAWSLIGTVLTPCGLHQVVASRKPVIIMLDPDAAGYAGARRIRKTLASIGVPCTIAEIHKDPKNMTKEELTDVIRLATP